VARIWSDRPIELEEIEGVGCDADRFSFESSAGLGRVELENTLVHQPAGIESVAKALGVGPEGVLDFTVVRLPESGPAAAIFTRNRCPGDAVISGRANVADGRLRLVCVVSKNANVFTPNGADDVERIIDALAQEFGVERGDVLLSCTGVIGVPLPMDRIVGGIPGLAAELEPTRLERSAEAILTTDPAPKWASVRVGDAVICGFVKGAGMIEPNMATMLGYLFTNARVPATELDAMLRRCAARTWNAISVDSDTSTSDTVAILSTDEVELSRAQTADFEHALLMLCAKLARDVVGRGEGVENLIEVDVAIETSEADAAALARVLINSPLVKTAVHGADPNWGRIVMAIGKPAAQVGFDRIDPSTLSIRVMGEKVFDRGRAVAADLEALSNAMRAAKTTLIDVEIGEPRHRFKAWGCDLTHEYIHINADYTT